MSLGGLSASWRMILLGEQPKEKALLLSQQGFFFVAENGEISNLKLVDDILKILEFIKSRLL